MNDTADTAATRRPPEGELITAIDAAGELYPIDKLEAHRRDVHHLAISVFMFCEGRLLMQQRADGKYHSGGLWANTCCSHPRWNESLDDCAHRRQFEELGCRTPLRSFGQIDYATPVGQLFENEAAHCYVGYLDTLTDPVPYNPMEVQAVAWSTLPELRRAIVARPENYTPWIRIYMQQHFELIAAVAHEATVEHAW